MTKMIDENTRLIDATLLIEGVDALLKEVDSGAVEILEAVRLGIKAQPTIDAVEVVRCKECRHWSNGDDIHGICYRCPNTRQMKHDDFCSYGERRE